jgi:hypothetical protein
MKVFAAAILGAVASAVKSRDEEHTDMDDTYFDE